VFAFVRRHRLPSPAPVELELLLRFYDGFASHVPEIVHSEFRSLKP
jgi:hypothetical protein